MQTMKAIECASKMEVIVFGNLVIRVTFIRVASFYWLEENYNSVKTNKWGSLEIILEDAYYTDSQNVLCVFGIHVFPVLHLQVSTTNPSWHKVSFLDLFIFL